ncbi:enoyl-CoA hydratase-related protein [Streptomyces sp. SAI-229]|uniref:enoyl-CoA hydratase-related protein n=1 Tax=Streptomyces sp. SAI-229 TaxID=3377731 RepID=UPI003C7AC9ED
MIARVNGHALGGGFELALACDLVVADHAVFALPEATLGLVPGAGGAFRPARQTPLKQAMGHLLTGRRMSAAEALRFGLVNEVVPLHDLDAAVDTWTDALRRSAPLSVRALKEAVQRSLHLPLEEAFTATYPWEEKRRRSHDAAERPRAFAGKRAPVRRLTRHPHRHTRSRGPTHPVVRAGPGRTAPQTLRPGGRSTARAQRLNTAGAPPRPTRQRLIAAGVRCHREP